MPDQLFIIDVGPDKDGKRTSQDQGIDSCSRRITQRGSMTKSSRVGAPVSSSSFSCVQSITTTLEHLALSLDLFFWTVLSRNSLPGVMLCFPPAIASSIADGVAHPLCQFGHYPSGSFIFERRYTRFWLTGSTAPPSPHVPLGNARKQLSRLQSDQSFTSFQLLIDLFVHKQDKWL